MTERTIRAYARELAARFYEDTLSAKTREQKLQVRDPMTGELIREIDPKAFIKSFPTLKDYLAGRRHGRTEHVYGNGIVTVRFVDDGRITVVPPGWTHHYSRAREDLTKMLGMDSVHENRKQEIYEAILEDREEQFAQQQTGIQPSRIPQRREDA